MSKISFLIILAFSSITYIPTQKEGFYFILVVDGVWQHNTGYASEILHYPGLRNCNNYRDTCFIWRRREPSARI